MRWLPARSHGFQQIRGQRTNRIEFHIVGLLGSLEVRKLGNGAAAQDAYFQGRETII